MLRRLTAAFLDNYLSWLVDPINEGFDFLLGPPVETFTEYAAQSNATPGAIEWVIAMGFALLFLGVSVAGMYLLLDLISPISNRLYKSTTGQKLTQSRRFVTAGVIQATLLTVDAVIQGEVFVFQITRRLAEDLAVVMAMFRGEVPDAGVSISGFTWGLLGDPMWEFVVQVGLLIGLTSVVVWKFTDYSETWVTIFLFVGSVVVWVYVQVEGIQVFPLDVRVAFPLQLTVVWGIMSVIAGILMMAAWGVLEWFPWVRYDHSKPKKLYMTFHGLILLAMFPLFGQNILALLAWFSAMLALYGGGEKAVRILLGYDKECRPDPETGLETCEWKRGD